MFVEKGSNLSVLCVVNVCKMVLGVKIYARSSISVTFMAQKIIIVADSTRVGSK